ncbi:MULTISPECIES: hypothetical protein [unclassified Fischerella]|nr:MULTISPECIES: hypothetical protein [unclassified Fischerella]
MFSQLNANIGEGDTSIELEYLLQMRNQPTFGTIALVKMSM